MIRGLKKPHTNKNKTKQNPNNTPHSPYMRKKILKLVFNIWKKSLEAKNLQNNKRKTRKQKLPIAIIKKSTGIYGLGKFEAFIVADF